MNSLQSGMDVGAETEGNVLRGFGACCPTTLVATTQEPRTSASARGGQCFDFETRTGPTRQGEKLETKKRTDVLEFQLSDVNEAL
jgi:hypothetical protein